MEGSFDVNQDYEGAENADDETIIQIRDAVLEGMTPLLLQMKDEIVKDVVANLQPMIQASANAEDIYSHRRGSHGQGPSVSRLRVLSRL